jgi:prepilin-type N-terminal cleavage/methylation domain-containing protein
MITLLGIRLQNNHHHHGFSLVEMSMVIVVLGLLVGLGLTAGQAQINVTKYQATQATLTNTKTALDLYYSKYKRYPCPALPADAPAAATYGVEVAGGCATACPAGLTCPASSKAVIGSLPYKTLNLGEEFAADDWGNKLNYTVDKDFTVANTTAIYGSIPIMDKNGNEITKSVDAGKAIYSLLSSGATGNGAWSKQGGARATCDATRKDGANCTGAANVTDTSINDGTAAGSNSFDDVVLWKVRETSDHIVIAAPSAPSVPTTPSIIIPASRIVIGEDYTCVLQADNTVWCSGADTGSGGGQLGNGATGGTITFGQEVLNFNDWTSIRGDAGGVCGLRSNGRAYCWGSNNTGQVANGTTGASVQTPTEVSGGFTDWTFIDRDYDHGCGIRNGGRAYCWGRNISGEIGDGTTTSKTIPTEVSGGFTDWKYVDTGDWSTCGIRTNNKIYCWGDNARGQVGDGTSSDSSIPVEISGGFSDWVYLNTAGPGSCALRQTGQLYCWGQNDYGQVGNGTTGNINIPTLVTGGFTDWIWEFFGWGVSCGIRNTGQIYCWGRNENGGVGTGSSVPSVLPNPTLVGGGFSDWKYVATDTHNHACAARSSGALYCWGINPNGQFGDGSAPSGIVKGATLIPGITVKVN